MRKIARFILRLMGWEVDKHTPQDVKKCVIVVGPHTSNWDFIIGKLAFISYGVKVKFLIKKEIFIPPFGWILKAMGGVPVDRSKSNNLTDSAVKYFNENEYMYLVFTPEGTRSYNPNWKKGFYYIAQKAKVPIYIAYMDYANKKGGFHSLFEPTGDVSKDIDYIKSVLSQFKGKHPENGIR
ncbi:MAG: 1-acyl-sn-glycerol-3-phosphate acyltransferase [Crocinitomicaceae bacterium]|nr:1-acyl-sn-glycerol-3-phosphate acyltransferase [Crocinitomicaceae bacterium]